MILKNGEYILLFGSNRGSVSYCKVNKCERKAVGP